MCAELNNPWLSIPLGDYEGHMSLAAVGQAAMLADQLERVIVQYSPESIAVIGCSGGNGLERIVGRNVKRVVAVDLNPDYVEQTRNRHAQRIEGLELLCADVQSKSLHFAPVDLIYAALLFEYVNVPSALRTLKRNSRPNALLTTVLQLPNATLQEISPSPYQALGRLAPIIKIAATGQAAARRCRNRLHFTRLVNHRTTIRQIVLCPNIPRLSAIINVAARSSSLAAFIAIGGSVFIMQTTTTFELSGFRVTKSLGVVRGITVRTRSLPMSILGGLRTLFGGRAGIFSALCESAREESFQLMIAHARKLGANAVVGIRYDTGPMVGAAEVLCYGTAVVVEPA